MVRGLAKGDHDKAEKVLRWPMREALIAYVMEGRTAAMEQYRWACVMYALQAPYSKEKMSPPEIPPILREIVGG